ncbi:chloride channel protein [Sphingomonas panacis]|uniref:Chloride channel protein n=1 Tax=Sphingomonas panacis TaxID=1560345 RepID=A0A1B3ZH21_9SPHN|nr:chloride channel protein [Sphingomonas panacis]AOH86734.1 chloride channel protein [Sphingomonas panacis]
MTRSWVSVARERLGRWVRGRKHGLDLPLGVFRRRIATGIGAVLLGLVALLFAKAGDWAQHLFAQGVARWPYAPLLVSPAIFACITWATMRWVPQARGSGIPQVIAASRTPERSSLGPLVSLRTALAKIAMTVVMLFAGASVGREGPTVQVSAAIMIAVHRLLRVPITAGVLIAGGAAGVAAAFNTPLAGVAFAIEELASAYEQRVAVLVMAAVMISGLVSLGIAGDYVYFGTMRQTLPILSVLLICPVAGVVGGVSGGLFSRIVLAFGAPKHRWLVRLRSRPVLFSAGCGLVVAVVGITSGGALWGTGYDATRHLVEGGAGSLWFGPGKAIATLATTLSGTPGGIFAPSLAVGAGIGHLVAAAFPNDPGGAVVTLGMVAYFVGVVRAPLTAVIIITETTASRGMILPLFATALIADAVSAVISPERLYHGLSRAFVEPARDPVTDRT